MNVYSELLDLLSPRQGAAEPGLLGYLTALEPLTVTVHGTALTAGLYLPAGRVFRPEELGTALALVPWEDGFLILTEVEA